MLTSCQFRVVPPAEVVSRWDEIRPLLERAEEHAEGEITVADVLEAVRQNRTFIAVLEAAGVVELALAAEVAKYPRKSILNVIFVGGKNGKVVAQEHYPRLEEIGRMFGCSSVQCYCRPAVARYLKRLFPDMREAYRVMRRDL